VGTDDFLTGNATNVAHDSLLDFMTIFYDLHIC